jgi:hypothetical protein
MMEAIAILAVCGILAALFFSSSASVPQHSRALQNHLLDRSRQVKFSRIKSGSQG